MKRLLFLLILLFVPPPGAFAATTYSLADFLVRLKGRAVTVDGFTCDFRQERRLKLFRRPVVFTGTLSVARPRKLAWTTVSPLPSRLIIDNDHGLRCVDGRGTRFDLAADPVTAAVTEQMWSFVNGSFATVPPGWKLALTGPETVTVTPDDNGFFAKISVGFDPVELRPLRVELDRNNGDVTIITFHDYRAVIPGAFSGCGGGR